MGSGREDGFSRGWTFTTALHLTRRARRRRSLEQRARQLIGRPPTDPSGLDQYISVEMRDALAALPKRTRAICALFYVADRRVEEIGRVLGVSTSTVTSTLTAGRNRLRAILQDRSERTETNVDG